MDDRDRSQARSFAQLDYEGFRALAARSDLSANERIRFPDSVRGGRDQDILADIRAKLPALADGAVPGLIVDIGPGAGPLAQVLVATCLAQGHELWLLDSPEMLAVLPDAPGVTKRPGRFPDDTGPLPELAGRARGPRRRQRRRGREGPHPGDFVPRRRRQQGCDGPVLAYLDSFREFQPIGESLVAQSNLALRK
jgi:hypothetical protein